MDELELVIDLKYSQSIEDLQAVFSRFAESLVITDTYPDRENIVLLIAKISEQEFGEKFSQIDVKSYNEKTLPKELITRISTISPVTFKSKRQTSL